MPDSIHNVHTQHAAPVPATLPPLPGEEAATPHMDLPALPDHDAAAVKELVSAHTGTTTTKKNVTQPPTARTLPAAPDSLTADTTAADTATAHAKTRLGISVDPSGQAHAPRAATTGTERGDTASWVITGLLLLFLLVAFRMRRNFKYLKGLLHETVNSRTRQNMFVDTARETTFAMLLNLLCVACCALLLAQGANLTRMGETPPSGEFPPGLWVCGALSAGYWLLQWIAYLIIGHTFTTPAGANLWIQGFKACSALLGLVLFPLALIGVFYPAGLTWVLTAALTLYFSARVLFIFKGIRIFSGHRTYYILFLYYLCSVEIVPVLLIWQAACLWG